MNFINEMKNLVLAGDNITKEQALKLYSSDISELSFAANEIREHFCGNIFDICTIINAKSGKCSENCKYCAQSAHFNTNCDTYPLLSSEQLSVGAIKNEQDGILRYSIVTSGKNISDSEVEQICQAVQQIKSSCDIKVCGSFGLLNTKQYQKLHSAGLTRIHNNLESSKEYFKNVCTTHTFEDKLNSISMAKQAGMNICSGGIFGLGESVQDRISLAFSLKNLGITSVPINVLNPIKGTLCENNIILEQSELCRIVAIFRFILPTAFIRLAGGRGLMQDKGRSAFLSGANAAISGDMLTTSGITAKSDFEMIEDLGFKVGIKNE